MVVARGRGGEGRIGSSYLSGTVSVLQIESILEMGGGDDCTTR